MNRLLLPLLLPALAAYASAQITPPREWSQPHGNAAGTACVDVAPLKAPPAERWRIKSTAVLAGPVMSQQKLFVVVREGDAKQLLVLDPVTGATVAKAVLDKVGDISSMAAGDGLAEIVDATNVHLWRMAGSELRFEKSLPGTYGGEAMLTGATLLVSRGAAGGAQAIDGTTSKPTMLVPKAFGRPGALMDDKFGDKSGRSLVATTLEEKEGKLVFNRYPVLPGGGASAGSIKLGPAETLYTAPMSASPENAPKTVLVAVQGKEGTEWCAWFGSDSGGGLLRKAGIKFAEFKLPPASANGRLYGFRHDSTLVEIDVLNGGTVPLIEKEDLRKGAQLGAPSIARDVLYLGNWAVEFGTRKVLWCLDTVEVDGPAIPIGDELIAVKTKDGNLVGYGSANAAKAAAAAAKSPNAPVLPSGPPLMPGSKPGLLRSDGRFIPGKTTALDGGRWRVDIDGGKPYELDAIDVALVDDGKKAERIGDEGPIYRACWDVLSRKHAESLVPVFEKWREIKLYDECARLLEEMKSNGLAPDQWDTLQGSIAGKNSAKLGPTAAPRKKAAELEKAARESSCEAIVAAARWCAAKDAKTAATVLATRATELAPKTPPDPDLVKSWTPELFPEKLEDAAGKTWPQWAEALLPSGARFAVLDEATKRRASVSKFAQGSLVISTRNILLYTWERDPAVLGPLLSRGEATVRALQKLLGPSPTGMRSDTMLEVHLFRTRDEYLHDQSLGSGPPAWSAGCFSPNDGISRFFSQVGNDDDDPLAHTLHEVFAHELTHHYTDRRWMREGKRAPNGYWMVEGFAEFVAGQALEFGRFGETFDDATVKSVDETAAAWRVEQLIDLEYLMGLDSPRFHKELEGGRFGPIKLRHSLKEVMMDKRYLFYSQSTALTFFVINRCGEKGRATYVSWLQKVYSGQELVTPWKELGFPDIAAFRKAFQEFLGGV